MLEQQSATSTLNKSILANIFRPRPSRSSNAIKEYERLTDEDSDAGYWTPAAQAAIAKMDELDAWHFDAKVKQITGQA